MADPIVIRPGGYITAKPRQEIGQRGASAFLQNPFTIEGFQNLISYYGQYAYPILNSAADIVGSNVSHYFGNDNSSVIDRVDMSLQPMLATIVQTGGGGVGGSHLNINGEFPWETVSTNADPTVAAEPFSTGGTITVASGSNIVTGAGTTFTTYTLTGGGAAVTHPAMNQIQRGDILSVRVNASRYISFRITGVTDNTHLTIWPTPSASNPALGSGLTYAIYRSGYNSYSRVLAFNEPQGSGTWYLYYCGGVATPTTYYPYGTIQCVAFNVGGTPNAKHYMSPQTVDSAGNPVADIQANDLIYYKGFILFGAGPAIGWSVAGAPNTLPFANTDFPAKNETVIDPASTFVSFEYLGDQLIAFFTNSTWLVTATGSVPEFTEYKLPEQMSCINPAVVDTGANPSGVTALVNYGRPTTSGRGAIFYVSNRGIEMLGGGLAEEVSSPVSMSIRALFGQDPLYLCWDNAADTVLVRSALGVNRTVSAIFNVRLQEWSTLWLGQPTGSAPNNLAALTASINAKVQTSDHTRLLHYAYYNTINQTIYSVAGLLDENTPNTGLIQWQWFSPVIPLGLEYQNSTGGILIDSFTENAASPGASMVWALYGGSSPYNLYLRDTGTIVLATDTAAGQILTTWQSSRVRSGKKLDDPFIMVVLYSTSWIAISSVTIFPAATAAKL